MNREREKQILKALLTEKQVTVKEMAKRLYASEPSIRRDFVSLENQGLIRRVHGGAVIEENSISSVKIPFVLRELEQGDAKVQIVKKAAALVKDYDVLFLDGSSSAYALAPYLAMKNHLTVITSGVKSLLKLGEYGIKVISTGGELLRSCQSLVGEAAHETIRRYHADIAFFSCRGLSEEGVLTDISDSENYVRRLMIEHSKKSYLLCAGEKLGKTYFHTLCTAREISGILCEKELSIRCGMGE